VNFDVLHHCYTFSVLGKASAFVQAKEDGKDFKYQDSNGTLYTFQQVLIQV
jgi:hypothetical protein